MWIYNAVSICTVLISLLTIAYLHTRRQFSFWSRKGVHSGKPHFIFGSFGDIVRKKVPTGSALIDLYNGFKGERFGGVWDMFTPKLYVVDPNLAGEILVKDFSTWSHRGATFNLDVDPLEGHLANLDGRRWKTLRTKLGPTFSSLKLKNMHQLLLESAKDLEKYLDSAAMKDEPVEATDMSVKFTTDVIGSCVFGINMSSLNNENAVFRKMGTKIFELTPRKKIVSVVQSGLPWLYKFFKLSSISRETSDFFINITKDTFDYREKNDVRRHDFMDYLRSLRNSGVSPGEDEVVFDDELLAAQAFAFFTAGFQTSSATISCCFHELAVNQDIQDRLREEVHRTKAADNGEISWEGLKNMKYLNMVVQETLRKYPIAPHLRRMSVKPYRIPGTSVDLPPGMIALIPIYALHHDPQYYPDPEKFDPERFTEEAKSQRPAFTYLPFGDGPRNCIGLRFAEQQVKMALVNVVDTFKVSLCEKSKNPLPLEIHGVFLQPKIGVWLKMSRYISNGNSSR